MPNVLIYTCVPHGSGAYGGAQESKVSPKILHSIMLRWSREVNEHTGPCCPPWAIRTLLSASRRQSYTIFMHVSATQDTFDISAGFSVSDIITLENAANDQQSIDK